MQWAKSRSRMWRRSCWRRCVSDGLLERWPVGVVDLLTFARRGATRHTRKNLISGGHYHSRKSITPPTAATKWCYGGTRSVACYGGTRSVASPSTRYAATTERGPPCLSSGRAMPSGGTRSVASLGRGLAATTERGPPNYPKTWAWPSKLPNNMCAALQIT